MTLDCSPFATYIDAKSNIATFIDNNLQEVSLIEIEEKAFEYYKHGKPMEVYRRDPLYGLYRMREELKTHYIIMCAIHGVVPRIHPKEDTAT